MDSPTRVKFEDLLLHYTNGKGHKAIRAFPTWRFLASQPPDPRHHPFGAYFTTLSPKTPNLALRLGIPRAKTEFVFTFEDAGDLTPIDSDRGRWIFFSAVDYDVERPRQQFEGRSDEA